MNSYQEVHNRGERSVEFTTEGWEYTLHGMIYLQQLFAYNEILQKCQSARVLDIGCGSGYGSRLLGQTACSVIGIDINAPAIQWAIERNDRSNVEYLCASIDSET